MGSSHRNHKVADRIKVVIAQLLETKIKDPRLGFVTVTDARVSGDLQNASIFYTVLGGEDERAATAAALESAEGIDAKTLASRSPWLVEICKREGFRFCPRLHIELFGHTRGT